MKCFRTVISSGCLVAVCLLVSQTVQAQSILITEIMFDPDGNNEHEYVEIYNTTASDIDLTDYALKVNGVENILNPGSMIPAGGIAVIIRTDNLARPLTNYIDAWDDEFEPTINFIELDAEGATLSPWQTLSNGGSTVEIVDDFFTTITTVVYDNIAPWPTPNDGPSIYLTDVNAIDPADGSNWALSADGVAGAHFGLPPRAGDIGSPGFIDSLGDPVANADFNGDNDVDGDDFLAWQQGFGGSSPGDANTDGTVDGTDLSIWQQQFGTGSALSAVTAVPEPTSCLLMTLCGLTLVARRRRS